MLDIRVEKTTTPKALPTKDNPLTFGTIFTDHMFIMNYETGKGWFDPRVVPYQPISLEPSCMVFHYGQEMFEGLKAYKAEDGRTLLFRPDMNAKRTNNTNKRLCIPEIPEEDFIEAVKAVVKVDEAWVPEKPGTSLYIRPFIIATDPFLGVRPSNTYLTFFPYRFMVLVISSVVGLPMRTSGTSISSSVAIGFPKGSVPVSVLTTNWTVVPFILLFLLWRQFLNRRIRSYMISNSKKFFI